MRAFPSPVGCVKATSPFAGSSLHPWMKVWAAAVNKLDAIPSRRWEDGTNSRGMPSAVGKGSGRQNTPVLVSTATKEAVGTSILDASRHSAGVAIAIAVLIRWAITQPTICSRLDDLDGGNRKRYTLDALRMAGVRAGADRVRLMVSSKVLT